MDSNPVSANTDSAFSRDIPARPSSKDIPAGRSIPAIRDMRLQEFKRFFTYLQSDFPAGEYPPYAIMRAQLKRGALVGLVYVDASGEDTAYAFNAVQPGQGMVLVSYYAVLSSRRGTGVGSAFLHALAEKYQAYRGMVVEVEKPELASSEAERTLRARRVRFYERAGFRLVPAVDYAIWGIPMHLMLRPLQDGNSAIEAELPSLMRALYLPLLGQAFIRRMTLRYQVP
jgi:GNAT superfamily N-acetyltransferase